MNESWPDFNHKRIGQLMICNGGTCGKTKKGAFPVPIDLLKSTIKEKGLKKYFKVTETECLGVCKPHNVSLLLTPDTQYWLGMLKDEKPYKELLQWIEKSVNNGKMLPIPQTLQPYLFDRFA
ncbi:MAG: (2Fe-2S) ferredoxin domain-containing protein [Candidatus Heimdallarchaeota archaeon]|nr:(2Fe-2S) ferredoxin domain-containing protein [Candidatus Heimdallarchaeota archaeon]